MMFKELELSQRQRATVAAAITLGAVLVLLAIFSVSVWGLARFIGAFQNVLLLPVVAGMMLAIPLTAFAVVFWRLLKKKKYITEVV